MNGREKLQMAKMSRARARGGRGWGGICALAHQKRVIGTVGLDKIQHMSEVWVVRSFKWDEVDVLNGI